MFVDVAPPGTPGRPATHAEAKADSRVVVASSAFSRHAFVAGPWRLEATTTISSQDRRVPAPKIKLGTHRKVTKSSWLISVQMKLDCGLCCEGNLRHDSSAWRHAATSASLGVIPNSTRNAARMNFNSSS